MDIKELSQIDVKELKNIDLSQILDFFKRRIDIAICTALVIGSIVFAVHIFGQKQEQASEIKEDIPKAKELLELISAKRSIDKEITKMTETLPEPLPGDKVIDKLSEIASEHNIQINTFSPASTISSEYVDLTTVSVSITADSYADLISFIEAIETSPYGLRLESWSANLDSGRGRSRRRSRRSAAEDNESPDLASSVKVGSLVVRE